MKREYKNSGRKSREQDDEGAQKVVTSYALKGASPNPVYKRYYDFLQESLRLRQELAQLEGLPPCPQPVAATPITGQYNSPFNDRSGYTGYRPFYYTPGYTPAPPAYNTPGYTSYPSYYNSPFYNAPVAPPPPVIGYSPFYNAPVYNAPWEGSGFLFRPNGQRFVLAGFGPDQANRTADDGQLVVDAPLDNRHLNQLGQQLRFFAVRLRQLARPERGRQQDQSSKLQHWL